MVKDNVARMRKYLRQNGIQYDGCYSMTPEGLEELAAVFYVAYEDERIKNRGLLAGLDEIKRKVERGPMLRGGIGL